MTGCSHFRPLSGTRGHCRLLSPHQRITAATCRLCQSQWQDGQEPTRDTLPRLLLLAVAPEKSATRPKCEHLGKPLERTACGCWQRWRHQCEVRTDPAGAPLVVLPERDCQACE